MQSKKVGVEEDPERLGSPRLEDGVGAAKMSGSKGEERTWLHLGQAR